MMMACQGHGHSTKQGCSWLIVNMTGTTYRWGWLLRLRSVTAEVQCSHHVCSLYQKSHLCLWFCLSNWKSKLPTTTHVWPGYSVSPFIPRPGMSLSPLSVYLNPTCLQDLPPLWSVHSRMLGTLVFVTQAGALISPCTGFWLLCVQLYWLWVLRGHTGSALSFLDLTVPACAGHKGMLTDSLDEPWWGL